VPPRVRKALLIVHLCSSIGWLGAVASFLALAIWGWTARDGTAAQAAYRAMDVVGWRVVVPLTFAALLTGLVQGFAGPWGVVRHYWIVMKLLITALCSGLVLLHMRPTGRLAHASPEELLTDSGLYALRVQLVADASLALGALLVAVALAVYKPPGKTGERMPLWFKLLGAIGVVMLLVGHGFARHGA